MRNRPLERALNSLTHPGVLIAIVLMVINDSILKPMAPSWVSGKLSDTAWLVIAPLVAAALLAFIAPGRHGKWIGLAAVFLCGAAFVVLKASPVVNQNLLEMARHLTGIPWATAADPSDLLALPALLIPYKVWMAADAQRIPTLRTWMVPALASLVLMADAAAPRDGISCLSHDGDQIIAYGNYGEDLYASSDGGLTWNTAPPGTEKQLCKKQHILEIGQPGNSQVRYRLTQGEGIERSSDGGGTWQREVSLNSEGVHYYYVRKFVADDAGPYAAIFDSRTGNLIVAMGFEGAMVRDTKGVWNRVAVGAYHYEELTTDQIAGLLSGEIQLAVLLVFLIFSLLNRVEAGFRTWDILLAVFGWLSWGLCVMLAPADIRNYGEDLRIPMLYFGVMFAALVALVWLVVIMPWEHRFLSILRDAGISICGGAAFLTPFLLWGANQIDRYQAAQTTAVVSLIAVVGVSATLILITRRSHKS